jgi:transcriptional regulatory protein RtcR
VESDFQLVAGTNRDLRVEVAAGRFREDLFARINLWSYVLPGLAQRPEDLEPNVDHLLARTGTELGRSVRFSNEARAAYLRYAQSPEALWTGNFRDLSASVTRLATLADSGRIGLPLVEAEIARLRWVWQPASDARQGRGAASPGARGREELAALLGDEAVESMDVFDRLQLAAVLQVCRQARTLSDAGRLLFQASRTQRTVVNDADRLRKYLARFGLDWERLAAASFRS